MTQEQIQQLRSKYNIQPLTGATGATTGATMGATMGATGTTDRLQMARDIVASRQTPVVDEKRNMFQRIGSDLSRRGSQLGETFRETARGEITPAETGIRTAGSILGGISDVAFRAAGGILRGLTPDVIEKPIVKAGEKLISKAVQAPAIKSTIETLTRLAQENPRAAKDIEALIDIATVLPVGAGAKATKPLIGAAEKAVSRTAQKGASVVKYGISQATGLGRETIETIIKNPASFSKKTAQLLDRESLGAQIKNTINKRLGAQATLGKEYDVIREMTEQVVKLGDTLKKPMLEKFGLKLKDGKILMTAESKPFAASEIGKIENFIDLYGKKELSPNAVLNAREALTQLAGSFEPGKTGTLVNWAKSTRQALNDVAHKQLPKLKDIDRAYSAEAGILKQIKKDYFKKGTNEFKDNALSKIANLTKEGRQPVLERLKQIVPDIEKKVNILRAIEDIKASGGIKVGTYVKGGLALGGIASGNIPLLLAAIFAQPEIIVPILRAWGRFRLAQKGLVEVIIKKLEEGVSLTKEEADFVSKAIGNWGERVIKSTENIKPGLSIQDVSKQPLKAKGEILKSTPKTPLVSKAEQGLIKEARKIMEKEGRPHRFDLSDDEFLKKVFLTKEEAAQNIVDAYKKNNSQMLTNRIKDAHSAPGLDDYTIKDVISGKSNQPKDILTLDGLKKYGNESFYGKETIKAINQAQKTGKIKIYRAVPKNVNKIESDDWVYLVKEQATTHGKNRLEGDYKILSKEVNIDDIRWDGNDIREWGYSPKSK